MLEPQSIYSFSTLLSFAITSGMMVFINKSISSSFEPFSFILIIQSISTIVLVIMWKVNVLWEISKAKVWLPCALLFGVNLYSSLSSLKLMHVSTFLVFKNMQPILVSLINLVWYRKTTKSVDFIYLVVTLLGSTLYASEHVFLNFKGSLWALFHTFSMSVYVIMVKEKNNGQIHFDTLDTVFYNNVISSVLFCFIFFSESNTFFLNQIKQNLYNCHKNENYCLLKIFFSCILGFWLSILGMECQKMLSPTSWVTYNNFVKLLTILVSCYLWNTKLNIREQVGLFFSFLGIFLYGIQFNVSGIGLKIKIITLITLLFLVGIIVIIHFNFPKKDKLWF